MIHCFKSDKKSILTNGKPTEKRILWFSFLDHRKGLLVANK